MKRTAMWLALLTGIAWLAAETYPRSILLVNAQILTMDEQAPVADSLLLRGQYIAAVGRRETVSQDLPLFTQTIDLQGRSVLPGFVDAHSHFPSSGLALAGLDLTPPPVGDVQTLTQLLIAVTEATRERPDGQWVIGFNYDDASLPEQRHPTRDELDKAAPLHPVYLWHRSGHMGVANSQALAALGHVDETIANKASRSFDAKAVDADRDEQGQLTGLLQESAAPRLSVLLRQLPYRSLLDAVLTARDQYLEAGITTVQNGFADLPSMHLLRWLQRLGILPQRVVVWPAQEKVSKYLSLSNEPETTQTPSEVLTQAIGWRGKSHRFQVSALKLIADGSPQGRTAWLSAPYKADIALPQGYRGFPSIPEAIFTDRVVRYHSAGMQLALHGNGDAAIDLIIRSLEAAQNRIRRNDMRHVVVHAQTIRQDQLQSLARLGASATFFPAHTYYWGDWYRERVLGNERAQQISPLSQADEAGLPYSLHSDAPVTPIDPMQILWSATQRQTLSGHVLGASLAVDRQRALRAMTIDAAWQNHLEQDRGTLEVGKLADLVVLSGDPLTEPDVRNLHVQQVWIGGHRVFQLQQ